LQFTIFGNHIKQVFEKPWSHLNKLHPMSNFRQLAEIIEMPFEELKSASVAWF
jgi:hypothetical protein